ncbi:hypothetical protein [Thalassobius sp. I31.1]|uniref:hypothetical protein n=1 Tax=Thalassobius sp. I31.1 TaxID=2109912 RepID=UPI000D1AC2A6|nr:hypothetical protein [Thalassobius sp. I31.1]
MQKIEEKRLTTMKYGVLATGTVVFLVLILVLSKINFWGFASSGFNVADLVGLPLSELKLNEWGDFLAGVGGTLALVWLIVSTRIQNDELVAQRKELESQNAELENQTRALLEVGQAMSAQKMAMDQQVAVLRDQSKILSRGLTNAEEDRAWHDIEQLLGAFREAVPIYDDFIYWEFEVGEKICFSYNPTQDDELGKLGDQIFLGRAAGGVRVPMEKLKSKLEEGAKIVRKCSGLSKLSRLLELIDHIDALTIKVPRHRKDLIDTCRLSLWRENIRIALKSYEKG